MYTIKLKLHRGNDLLAKIRYHVDSNFLKIIYYAILNLISNTAANYGGIPKPKT